VIDDGGDDFLKVHGIPFLLFCKELCSSDRNRLREGAGGHQREKNFFWGGICRPKTLAPTVNETGCEGPPSRRLAA
jgi:hypothetical protein